MKSPFIKLSQFQSFKEWCGYKGFAHYVVKRFKIDFRAHKSVDISGLEEIEIDFYQRSLLLHRAIDWSVEAGDLSSGKLILTHLVKLGGGGYGFTSIWNKVVALWCKWGEVDFARFVFDEMPMRNTVSYNTLISAYVRGKCDVFEAFRIYLRMVDEDVKPNHITFAALIGACGDEVSVRLLEVFHGLVVKLGLSGNEYVGSSIVDRYTKQRRLEDALKAFDEIAEADLVSWNILIDGCARSSSTDQAFCIFRRILLENVEFDEFTLTSVVKTCAEPKDMNSGMQIHCCAVKVGFSGSTAISNSLITMYAKCERGMKAALKVFEEIQVGNVISWTAIIAGLMQDKLYKEAINLYKRMLTSGVDENQFTLASIIPAIGNLANLEQGRQIHARAAKSRSGSDVTVNNALIDMYSKCGNLDDARLVFETMGNHDTVTCTTMITALGQHGMVNEALEILKAMNVEKLRPDNVTFLSCLSACSHSGLLDEGIALFRNMADVYSMKPRKEHFSCVVDMLGRAGRLSEAEMFIYDMGLELDVLVWEPLLGACRLHEEMTIGERSAKKIMELRPEWHGPYVLLSDMYAAKGLWKDKGLVRQKLAVRGMKKEPGGSWIH
ncbi:hypothetical protein QQ045_005473 [Rhodiola kirilowii]